MPLPRCPPGFTDHVFKTVHGLKLPLRYWPPRTAPPSASPPSIPGQPNGDSVEKPKGEGSEFPWLLWVHGGGYTCGKWSHPTPWLLPAFRDYGLISVGYRLQPEASLRDMTEDVVDAYLYARHSLGLSNRCVIGGASAGTTMAALAALDLQRRGEPPAAFLSVYGLVDSLAYLDQERSQPPDLNPSYLVSTDEGLAEIYRNPNPEKASVQNPWAEELPPHTTLQETRDHLGLPDYEPTEAELRRVDLYSYAAAHKNLIESICRQSKCGSDEEFREAVKRESPTHLLNKEEGFVPSFFMHGLADDIVPASHSKEMAETLRGMGVPTEEVYIEGAGHVYDFGFDKAGDAGWDESVGPCMRFLAKHV